MKDKQISSPLMKSLAREVSKEELELVSGAGTVVKTSEAQMTSGGTEENTYDSNGKYIGSDTIVRD